MIDAEGQDYAVLQSVDLRGLGVLLVIVEHSRLTEEETRAAHALLNDAGYDVSVLGGNTVAMSRQANDLAPTMRLAWALARSHETAADSAYDA